MAAKILLKSNLRDKDVEDMIKREISFSKYFRHPNIIRLYEVIETRQEIILIMEYASGGELFNLICSRKISENEARRIFQQIIFGLEYLHAHQVCHRDLKPENILLDEENNVKIADFGLSNVMRDGIFLYSSRGSPHYAAPELLTGTFYNGSSIDIWSCGVILYTLLTGTLPFDERETQKLYQKIKECRYVLPQKLNDLEKDLIFRMLQKDPLNRITIQEIKQHKWFNNKISLYQIIDNKHYIYGNMKKVDEEIIKEMKGNEKINFEGLSDEEIKKAILNRDKKDFCTIYEFLEVKKKEKLDKERNETLKNDVNFFKRIEQSKEAETVLQKLKNKFQKLSTTTEGSSNNLNKNRDLWRVGVEVNKECFEITTEILEFLKNFGYEWKIVSNSYKIKCRKKRNDEELKLEKIKGELNVLIQIFNNKSNNNMNFGNNAGTYVLDLHKLSGKSMEFLEFCNDLISSLQKKNLIK